MPIVKYSIDLKDTDRMVLRDLVSKGVAPAKMILRANILLASDSANPRHMTVSEVASAFNTSTTTVQKTRTAYAIHGLDLSIHRRKRKTPPMPSKVTGEVEARVIALACGKPPEGYARWSVRLVAQKCIELDILPTVSHMTVARILKKTHTSLI